MPKIQLTLLDCDFPYKNTHYHQRTLRTSALCLKQEVPYCPSPSATELEKPDQVSLLCQCNRKRESFMKQSVDEIY